MVPTAATISSIEGERRRSDLLGRQGPRSRPEVPCEREDEAKPLFAKVCAAFTRHRVLFGHCSNPFGEHRRREPGNRFYGRHLGPPSYLPLPPFSPLLACIRGPIQRVSTNGKGTFGAGGTRQQRIRPCRFQQRADRHARRKKGFRIGRHEVSRTLLQYHGNVMLRAEVQTNDPLPIPPE